MAKEDTTRRDLLHSLGALSLVTLLPPPREAAAQAAGGSPVKVDTKGLSAKIKFESVLAGYLSELNGKYKLRVTELVLEPGGYVGEHHHVGPGIRQVTSGYMTYVLPDRTLVNGPGDFFFESGDINHTAQNKTNAPMVHVLFEILPADHKGPSIMSATKALTTRRRGPTACPATVVAGRRAEVASWTVERRRTVGISRGRSPAAACRGSAGVWRGDRSSVEGRTISYPLSSFLNSFRNRQSVFWAIRRCGVERIMSASRRRKA